MNGLVEVLAAHRLTGATRRLTEDECTCGAWTETFYTHVAAAVLTWVGEVAADEGVRGPRITDTEVEILLVPCACGHRIDDHGTLGGCWLCAETNDSECGRTFTDDLLAERLATIVQARIAAFLGALAGEEGAREGDSEPLTAPRSDLQGSGGVVGPDGDGEGVQ